ncbi:MAG: rhombosortase [Steroidobacterales bacterium]
MADGALRRALQSVNGDGRYGTTVVVLTVLLWVPAVGGDRWRLALRYDRGALLARQWWRLLSAHLVHLDARHIALNAAGLLLLWALFARVLRPWQWLIVTLITALGIDAGLWWLAPQVQWYVGASGVLHGVWSGGTVALLRQRERFGVAVLALLVVKLAYERIADTTPFAYGLPVVPQAHFYGACAGALAALVVTQKHKPL